jgi:hypothetical protein
VPDAGRLQRLESFLAEVMEVKQIQIDIMICISCVIK